MNKNMNKNRKSENTLSQHFYLRFLKMVSDSSPKAVYMTKFKPMDQRSCPLYASVLQLLSFACGYAPQPSRLLSIPNFHLVSLYKCIMNVSEAFLPLLMSFFRAQDPPGQCVGTELRVPPKLEEDTNGTLTTYLSIHAYNRSQRLWKEDIRCREVRWCSCAPGYDATAQKSQEKIRNNLP